MDACRKGRRFAAVAAFAVGIVAFAAGFAAFAAAPPCGICFAAPRGGSDAAQAADVQGISMPIAEERAVCEQVADAQAVCEKVADTHIVCEQVADVRAVCRQAGGVSVEAANVCVAGSEQAFARRPGAIRPAAAIFR